MVTEHLSTWRRIWSHRGSYSLRTKRPAGQRERAFAAAPCGTCKAVDDLDAKAGRTLNARVMYSVLKAAPRTVTGTIGTRRPSGAGRLRQRGAPRIDHAWRDAGFRPRRCNLAGPFADAEGTRAPRRRLPCGGRGGGSRGCRADAK